MTDTKRDLAHFDMAVDAGDAIGQPGLRVDAVELGCADKGTHEGCALAAAL